MPAFHHAGNSSAKLSDILNMTSTDVKPTPPSSLAAAGGSMPQDASPVPTEGVNPSPSPQPSEQQVVSAPGVPTASPAPEAAEANSSAPEPAEAVLILPSTFVALKDEPKYAKYFKMLKSGVPAPAVVHRMVADGLDPAILECDPDQPMPAKFSEFTDGPPLGEDEKYSKYFKVWSLRGMFLLRMPVSCAGILVQLNGLWAVQVQTFSCYYIQVVLSYHSLLIGAVIV